MRVYIGPYRNDWLNTQSAWRWWIEWNHPEKSYYEIGEADFTKWDFRVEKFLDLWQDYVLHPLNKVFFSKLKRKIKVRIDDTDLWSMDHTLALIIVPMLKKLKEQKHGTPYTDREDAPDGPEFEDDSDPTRDPSGYSEARWNYIMDRMIWSFEQILDEDEGHWNYYVPYEENEHVERLFISGKDGEKKYLDTEERARKRGRYDPELHRQYNDKIAVGLKLFGKYYRNLWD
jgi:hypothetical protein